MKYLKLFNESITSSSDYYEEVNFNEFDKLKKLRIPMVLVKKISMRLNPDYLTNRKISPSYLFINSYEFGYPKKYLIPKKSSSDLSFTIRMSADEWFWVDVDNSLGLRKDLEDHVYYKCDQEEGLMRLLGDLGLFKD